MCAAGGGVGEATYLVVVYSELYSMCTHNIPQSGKYSPGNWNLLLLHLF